MALVLKKMYNGYFWLFEDISDPRANDYYFMSSPIPMILLLAVYLRFTLSWGPQHMKNKPPYDLRNILIVYNVVQILSNIYILVKILHSTYNKTPGKHNKVWADIWAAILGLMNFKLKGVPLMPNFNWYCTPVDYTETGREVLRLTYIYYVTKVVDLLDTVFFVLRKKDSQLSFLHIYHHFGMVIVTWIGVKFIGGGHSYYLGFVNTIVHVIMYTYYLITAIDSRIKSILWIKKFITQLQLAQFLFLLYVYGKLLFINDCKYPKVVSYFFVPQNIFMSALFLDFYVRAYIWPTKKSRAKQEE